MENGKGKYKMYSIMETRFLVEQRLVDGEWKVTKKFPLTLVTEEELLDLRLESKPGFVLKKEGCYYYTPIRGAIKCYTTELHQCGQECKRLYPLSDCDGGCAKVRDVDVDYTETYLYNRKKAIIFSKRIEKYPFIEYGYQTFNTKSDCFAVFRCNNYEKEKPKRQMSLKEINQAKRNLEDFYEDYRW